MYVEYVIIDGFKSYSDRTEIGLFDRYFNAITGLNGSGKSNILDAICFVLGISNLTSIRVGSLHELIYKNGKAGVTRASVSVIFNNTDPDQSPVGYEEYKEIIVTRQVFIGGRNKYLINGFYCNLARIHDMFASVKMNINNPNFLIMQGKITKVINMKPPEILSMVEVAAGTGIYESKRVVAMKTLEKKNNKLIHINTILDTEIEPIIGKLRKEKSQFIEYQNLKRKIDHLEKEMIVFDYMKMIKTKSESENFLLQVRSYLKNAAVEESQLNSALKDVMQEIAENQRILDEKSGGSLFEAERITGLLRVDESKLLVQHDHILSGYKNDDNQLNQLLKGVAENNSFINSRESSIKAMLSELSEKVSMLEKNEKEMSVLSDEVASYEAGADAVDLKEAIRNRMNEYQRVCFDLENAISSLEFTVKKCEINRIKSEKQASSFEEEYKIIMEKVDKLEREYKEQETTVNNINFDIKQYASLQEENKLLKTKLADTMNKVRDVEVTNNRFSFDYNLDSGIRLDREKIYGLMFAQFLIKNVEKHALALEVAAGGKLGYVVVDDDETAKILLKNGQLKKRTTFIALTRMQAKNIAYELELKLRNLGLAGDVFAASNLVTYDEKMTPAINFVFGSTVICSNKEDAKKIVYEHKVNIRCVTYEGDIYEPSGTLTGGSRAKENSLLRSYLVYKDLKMEEAALKEKIGECVKQLEAIEQLKRCYEDAKIQLELKIHELSLQKETMKACQYFKYQETNEKLKREEKEIEDELQAKKVMLKSTNEKLLQCEAELSISQPDNAQRKKTAVMDIARLKENIKTLNKEVNDIKLKLTVFEEEVAQSKKEIEEDEILLSKLKVSVGTHKRDLEQSEKELSDIRRKISEKEEEISQIKEELNKYDRKHAELSKNKRSVEDELVKIEIKRKEIANDISKCEEKLAYSTKKIAELEKKNSWLATQEIHSTDIEKDENISKDELLKQLKENRLAIANMEKNVNIKAIDHLNQAEEQYKKVKKNQRVVTNDKLSIEKMIAELDEKKVELISSAWKKINADFNNIFSTLLPGGGCKLFQVNEATPLDGLEIAVSIGGVWKEDTSELSGGQRSLVALSLILALLLYNPSPIYILDEIDAALDITHTQNLGIMISRYFRKSQFIIVSLKEGMFTNANVLFKAKCVEGISHIKRSVATHRRRRDNTANDTAPSFALRE